MSILIAPILEKNVEEKKNEEKINVRKVLTKNIVPQLPRLLFPLNPTFVANPDQKTVWTRGPFLGKGGFCEVHGMTMQLFPFSENAVGDLQCKRNSNSNSNGGNGTNSNEENENEMTEEILPGISYAGKIFTLSENERKRMKQEILIHSQMIHPNIVKLLSTFQTKECHVIVLELCNNKTLKEYVKRKKRLSENRTKLIMTQIVNGVKYIKSKRVIHRDLKLGNIFMNKDPVSKEINIKIGDFGLAIQYLPNQYCGKLGGAKAGTPNYISPETLLGHGYSYEADTWALGIIMFALLTGKTPFEKQDKPTTHAAIKEGIFEYPDDIIISTEAKDLIKKLLTMDPKLRPSHDDILNHEFFTQTK